jgi:hypothetical protein
MQVLLVGNSSSFFVEAKITKIQQTLKPNFEICNAQIIASVATVAAAVENDREHDDEHEEEVISLAEAATTK